MEATVFLPYLKYWSLMVVQGMSISKVCQLSCESSVHAKIIIK